MELELELELALAMELGLVLVLSLALAGRHLFLNIRVNELSHILSKSQWKMCVLRCVGPADPPPGGLADPVRQVLALLPLHLHRIHLLSRSLFDIVLSKSNQLLSDFPTQ